MTTTRRPQARTERTRAALVDAGLRLFSERPVDAVSVDDIVQAAGVGKGSFYNHFSDREALVMAISARIRARLEDRITQANHGVCDPARRLVRGLCVYLRYALDEPEATRMMARVLHGPPSPDHPLNRGLVEDLAAGLSQGRLTPPSMEAGVLLMHGSALATLARVAADPSADLAASMAEQIGVLVLRAMGLACDEADLIAAEAATDLVRPNGSSSA